MLKALREICINLLQGNIELTANEKEKLKRYKNALRSLADGQLSKRKGSKILISTSSQNIIKSLIPPVLSTIYDGKRNGPRTN